MQNKVELSYLVYFLGCKVNSYEIEAVAHLLENNGYRYFSKRDSFPTVIVINTCAVTKTSETKDKKIIRRFRLKYPNSIIVVMGCYSHFASEEIAKLDVDIIIGTENRNKIIELINDFKNTKKQLIIKDSSKKEYEDLIVEKFLFNTRAFVKIQDGCNNFCTYCLIPFIRGRSRSRKKEEILLEIKNLIKNGYKEIVLTGIDMASYGLDLYDDYCFSDLLEDILINNKDLYRIRISSIEESQIDDKFLVLLGKYPQIANHLHIPLQSGSENVLKKMHRKYNLNDYLNKVAKIREIRKDINISTDLIVGFPGETDDDFNKTVSFLKKINYSKIHVFPFSPRNGTIAYKLPNQIDPKIKKERVDVILKLNDELEKKYQKQFIGKKMEFLFERMKGSYFIGHSSNFLEIKVESKENINGMVIEKIFTM